MLLAIRLLGRHRKYDFCDEKDEKTMNGVCCKCKFICLCLISTSTEQEYIMAWQLATNHQEPCKTFPEYK